MKMTKAIMVVLALVIIVICFNAPAVYSGGEHPWDQEGTGSGSRSSTTTPPPSGLDTTKTVVAGAVNGTNPDLEKKDGKTSGLYTSYIVSVGFIFWYHDVPGLFGPESRSIVRQVSNVRTTNSVR